LRQIGCPFSNTSILKEMLKRKTTKIFSVTFHRTGSCRYGRNNRKALEGLPRIFGAGIAG
jgi:hypothetical protein